MNLREDRIPFNLIDAICTEKGMLQGYENIKQLKEWEIKIEELLPKNRTGDIKSEPTGQQNRSLRSEADSKPG
jgi:hypothetical protein